MAGSLARVFVLAGALLAACLPLPSAVAAQSAPGAAALDSVDRYLRAELARQKIPGMSVAVLRGDSVLLARGYGFANLEHRVPATPATLYQSASVGKQMTAALVLLLARDGVLGLDAPIHRWFPEAPAAWRPITVRHLLGHTSGIPDYTDGAVDYRRDYSEDELLAAALRLPLDFPPGESWRYSNTGYALLGFLVRRATGRFYGDLLKERIFGPAGMRTARVISESEIIPGRAAGYQLVEGEIRNQSWVAPTLNTTADGSLYLSVDDLVRWAVALTRRTVLDSAELALSWTPVRLNGGAAYGYGLGWGVDHQRGHPRIGHTGSWQGFKTSIQRYPESGLTVIALANLDAAEPAPVSYAVAGMLDPRLQAPHQLATRSAGAREPIGTLLAAIVAGRAGARVTSGLRNVVTGRARDEWRDELRKVRAWESVGCDDVRGRRLDRLGGRVARVCYARALGDGFRRLVSVAYTAEGIATDLDAYAY